MFVKPKPGMLVRDPVTRQPLPAEGADVPEDSYYMRRLVDGDIERVPNAVRDAAEEA